MAYVITNRGKNQFKILLKKSTVLAGVVQDKKMTMSIHAEKMRKAVKMVCEAKRAGTF